MSEINLNGTTYCTKLLAVTEILKEVIKTTSGPYFRFAINWDDGAKSIVIPKYNTVELIGIRGERTVLDFNMSQHGCDCAELITSEGYTFDN